MALDYNRTGFSLMLGFLDEDLCRSRGNLGSGEVGPQREVPFRKTWVQSYRSFEDI